jgi:hypothetical protein
VDPEDVVSIAAVSIPLPTPTLLQASLDGGQLAWVFSSPNHNLQVLAPGQGQTDQGPLFGFIVGIPTSLVRVARFEGRYILTDGYHRTHGLLKVGATRIPALVRDVESFEALGLPQGMLPQSAFLGTRPATLRDHLDSAVSADTRLPAMQRTVVLPALQVTSAG